MRLIVVAIIIVCLLQSAAILFAQQPGKRKVTIIEEDIPLPTVTQRRIFVEQEVPVFPHSAYPQAAPSIRYVPLAAPRILYVPVAAAPVPLYTDRYGLFGRRAYTTYSDGSVRRTR